MKLHNVLISSHFVTGLLSAVLAVWISARFSMSVTLAWAAAITGSVALGVGLMLTRRIVFGLANLEAAVSSGDSSHIQNTGLVDIDRVTNRLRAVIQRWGEAAATSREQSREIERMVKSLNRRSKESTRSRAQATGVQLREQLGSISAATTTELNQILECTREIGRRASEISSGASEQSDAVNKTTTYVEQMSVNIDSVAQNANAAQRAATTTRDSASEALKLVRELIDGMNCIRKHVEVSESRLRALGDHSQEIGSIVETIGAISSRTDMLALNASIESVRAGEHGRGFAVVAEEVRKLAEQAAQASREVGGLVESIQLETQESIALMAEEREEVEAEVSRVNAAGEALERISQVSADSASQVAEITQATQLQLQLTQEVVLAMERISDIARASRTRAEEACWTTNTLSKVAQQFDESLLPLRECSRVGGQDFQSVQAAAMAVEPSNADLEALETVCSVPTPVEA